MPVRVSNVGSVHVKEMVDGQIAVITDWSNENATGEIVRRYGTDLVFVGRPQATAFPGLFSDKDYDDECHCVRILLDGATLTAENNHD